MNGPRRAIHLKTKMQTAGRGWAGPSAHASGQYVQRTYSAAQGHEWHGFAWPTGRHGPMGPSGAPRGPAAWSTAWHRQLMGTRGQTGAPGGRVGQGYPFIGRRPAHSSLPKSADVVPHGSWARPRSAPVQITQAASPLPLSFPLDPPLDRVTLDVRAAHEWAGCRFPGTDRSVLRESDDNCPSNDDDHELATSNCEVIHPGGEAVGATETSMPFRPSRPFRPFGLCRPYGPLQCAAQCECPLRPPGNPLRF